MSEWGRDTLDLPARAHVWESRMVLADNECEHGTLPGDRRSCGCWVEGNDEDASVSLCIAV